MVVLDAGPVNIWEDRWSSRVACPSDPLTYFLIFYTDDDDDDEEEEEDVGDDGGGDDDDDLTYSITSI